KQCYYSESRINLRLYQMPKVFPESDSQNLAIIVNQGWKNNGNIALIASSVPDLHSNGDAQCFPLYLYDEAAQTTKDDLFSEPSKTGLRRRDAITDAGLSHIKEAYP